MSNRIASCDSSAASSNSVSSPSHTNDAFSFDLSIADIPTCIEKNLYLGSPEAATDLILLKEFSIKVILTVNTKPIEVHEEGIEYFFVKSDNEPGKNLLTRFDQCADLMTGCVRHDCPILVHCNYSFSVSSTVIVAYLMRKHRMTSDKALNYVKSRCPLILPNYGFINQLLIYERMNYKIDMTNRDYRFFMFSYFVNMCRVDISSNSIAEYVTNFLDYFNDAEMESEEMLKIVTNAKSVYRCNQCYVPLFFSHQVIQGPDWASRNNVRVIKECSSIFIEPITWMLRKENPNLIHNCILCPGCKDWIGHYYFSGMTCKVAAKGQYCLKHPIQSSCVFMILTDQIHFPDKNISSYIWHQI